jgi:hypothetical protein
VSPELIGRLTLFIAVPLNVVVTLMLLHQSRLHPKLRVLRERFIAAAAVLFTLVVFGLIFVNNDQAAPPLNEDATKIITRLAMLVVGVVPAAYWLWLYRAGGRKR